MSESSKRFNLQSVCEELVELADLRRDGCVDSAVTNLNDETTEDVRVDLETHDVSISPGLCIARYRTLVTTLSFLPWLYSDFATADSRR